MATAPRFVPAQDAELVREARKNLETTRDPDSNAISDPDLIGEVERIMPFNVAVEKRKKAVRMVRKAERMGSTEPDGSAWLPGFEPKAWEPERLIRDAAAGKTVEQDLATPEFVDAALVRKSENLYKQERSYRYEQALAEAFHSWATDQAANGRPTNEITLGNLLRDKGWWSPEPIEAEVEEGDD